MARIEVILQPEQIHLQKQVMELSNDAQHMMPKNMEKVTRISLPGTVSTAVLDKLGVTYVVRGRPSQGKSIVHYTVDQDVADYISRLPDGDRSRFVNSVLKEGIEKAQNGF